jgi:hypothetical protein
MTTELTDEQILRKYAAMYGRSKHAKMASAKPCSECGKPAIGVTDKGFRCEEHWIRTSDLNGDASLEET